MLILLWISVLVAVIDCSRAESCSLDEFHKCMKKVDFVHIVDFESTTEDFKENCEKTLIAVKCIRDYVRTCMSGAENTVFNLTTGGKLKIVEDHCTDGTELNTAYLKNMQCWSKTKRDLAYCESKFTYTQNKINEDDLEPRMKMFYGCCSFDWLKMCKITTVELKCNEEAKIYMEKLSKIQEGEIGQLCGHITSGPFTNCFGLYGEPNLNKDDLVTMFSDSSFHMASTTPSDSTIPFGVTAGDSCKESDYKKCLKEAEFKNDFNFDVTNEEFEKTCEKKLKALKCARDYERKCLMAQEVGGFRLIQDDSLKVVELLCSGEAKYDTGYLQNTACWDRMQNDIHYCDSKFRESQNEIHLRPPIKKVFHSCCAFDWVKKCKATSVELRCDEDTQNAIGWISKGLSSKLVDEVCDSVIPTSPDAKCTHLYGVEVEDLVTKFSNCTSLNPSYVISLLCFVLIKIKIYVL